MKTIKFTGWDPERFEASTEEELFTRWNQKGWVWELRDDCYVAWANDDDRQADGCFDYLRSGFCVPPNLLIYVD